jgi:hypothetical protein
VGEGLNVVVCEGEGETVTVVEGLDVGVEVEVRVGVIVEAISSVGGVILLGRHPKHRIKMIMNVKYRNFFDIAFPFESKLPEWDHIIFSKIIKEIPGVYCIIYWINFI